MDYTFKALTPEMADTFIGYFEDIDFGYAPHWASCYCRYYYTDCPQKEWQESSADKNREEAIREIKEGRMRGYLVFDKDKCIGWCSANDAASFGRLQEDIAPLIKGKKVGCVICFIIHPGYRGKGVARQLLNYIVNDFKAQGFEAVLALPSDRMDDPQKRYRGTLNMYKEQGFQEIGRDGEVSIMWLELSEAE